MLNKLMLGWRNWLLWALAPRGIGFGRGRGLVPKTVPKLAVFFLCVRRQHWQGIWVFTFLSFLRAGSCRPRSIWCDAQILGCQDIKSPVKRGSSVVGSRFGWKSDRNILWPVAGGQHSG